jgi:hypothetical protein
MPSHALERNFAGFQQLDEVRAGESKKIRGCLGGEVTLSGNDCDLATSAQVANDILQRGVDAFRQEDGFACRANHRG